MGQYRKIFTPFGIVAGEDYFDLSHNPDLTTHAGGYRTDWPGVVGTAAQIGVDAAQLIAGTTDLAPGAGVMAPSTAPALLQAAVAPPTTASAISPLVLLAVAGAVWYFWLRK